MADSVGTVPDLDGKITEDITHVQVFSASTPSDGAADGAPLAQSAPDHSYESTNPTSPQIEMIRQQVSSPIAARFAALAKTGASLGIKPGETQDIANLGNSTNATQASRQDDEKEATDSTKKKQSSEGLARIVKMVATPSRSKPSKALCTSKFLQLFASTASVCATSRRMRQARRRVVPMHLLPFTTTLVLANGLSCGNFNSKRFYFGTEVSFDPSKALLGSR